jgi:hypothetical protein
MLPATQNNLITLFPAKKKSKDPPATEEKEEKLKDIPPKTSYQTPKAHTSNTSKTN